MGVGHSEVASRGRPPRLGQLPALSYHRGQVVSVSPTSSCVWAPCRIRLLTELTYPSSQKVPLELTDRQPALQVIVSVGVSTFASPFASAPLLRRPRVVPVRASRHEVQRGLVAAQMALTRNDQTDLAEYRWDTTELLEACSAEVDTESIPLTLDWSSQCGIVRIVLGYKCQVTRARMRSCD